MASSAISYIPIQDLLVLNFGKHRAICMLKSSWDESGQSTDPPPQNVFMAGCIAPLERWNQFGTAWQAAMDEDGGGQIFQMAPFEARDNQFASLTDEQHDKLLPRLVGIVNACVPVLFASGASLTSVNSLPLEHDPYFQQLQICSQTASQVAAAISVDEKVEMFIEEEKRFVGRAAVIMADLRAQDKHLGPVAFPNKYESIQLQAADLFAWLARNEYRRRIFNPQALPHPALIGLQEEREWKIETDNYSAYFYFKK